MKRVFIFFFFFNVSTGFSQEKTTVLALEEYLGYVKKYHPIVKQARLITTKGEAKLLKSRGAFDPKLEIDYDRKKFKEIDYYDKLNATFKIPTWYGIELKANYENNDGQFLNPEFNVPNDGLYSVGVSISLAKGLLMNKRMAILKQAKLYTKQVQAKQTILINTILFNAITSYFNWLKNYQTKLVYEDYLLNAKVLLQNIKKNFFAGDKPSIDTLEANINYKNRLLDLEKAKISYIKSALELSNYLWLENNLPLELEDDIIPDKNTIDKVDDILNNSILNITNETIENHPKLQELQIKKERLIIDKRLKINNLLPKIDLEYNFITPKYTNINSFSVTDYKGGLNISFPLLFRKERAELKLTKLKLQDIEFDILATRVSLNNKIKSTLQEIESYSHQHKILIDLVKDYRKLVNNENRNFTLGEGSLFLVNYREVKYIETELKKIAIEYTLFINKYQLVRILNNLN